jgi:outer membrane lipoprotein-sorting protein
LSHLISRRNVSGGILAAVIAASAGFAAPPAVAAVDPALVAEAAAYLQSQGVVHGRFVQTDASGHALAGSFWIQRPGRARFDYDPPSGLSLAADGVGVSIVDRRLKTQRRVPLAATPLSLLLARNIRLDRSVRAAATGQDAGGFFVTLQSSNAKEPGEISLRFARNPTRLTGWTLVDARGLKVSVRLLGMARGAPRPISFFELATPGSTEPRPAG